MMRPGAGRVGVQKAQPREGAGSAGTQGRELEPEGSKQAQEKAGWVGVGWAVTAWEQRHAVLLTC